MTIGRLDNAGKIGVIIFWACLVCLLIDTETGSEEVEGIDKFSFE